MAHRVHLSVSMMFLSPSDDFCDLLLNRPMATWNLFVFFNKEEAKIDNDDVISSSVLQKIIVKNQSKYLRVSASHIIYLIHT